MNNYSMRLLIHNTFNHRETLIEVPYDIKLHELADYIILNHDYTFDIRHLINPYYIWIYNTRFEYGYCSDHELLNKEARLSELDLKLNEVFILEHENTHVYTKDIITVISKHKHEKPYTNKYVINE